MADELFTLETAQGDRIVIRNVAGGVIAERTGGRVIPLRPADPAETRAGRVVAEAADLPSLAAACAGLEVRRIIVAREQTVEVAAPFWREGVKVGFDQPYLEGDGWDFYAMDVVRGLDGELYAVPNPTFISEFCEVLATVDAAEDGGPVTWDDWETIGRFDDVYLVSRRGDVAYGVTVVGRFPDERAGLRAAASHATYFDFDEATGALVKLVQDYDEEDEDDEVELDEDEFEDDEDEFDDEDELDDLFEDEDELDDLLEDE